MPFNLIVLAKQVPDTKAVTGKAMNEDGTINRAALPAIFNPEDLNALELALQIRDAHGGDVTLVTMGLPSASDMLREGLYRGVDRAILVTDRRAAASDTLATSYILSQAVRKLGAFDFLLCGRQAIDGDTAQVGPQTAEKLGIGQVTYVQSMSLADQRRIRAMRLIEGGHEIVEAPLPLLLTVVDSANIPRPPALKRVMKYKKARSLAEIQAEVKNAMPDASDETRAARVEEIASDLEQRGLLITQWNLDDIDADLQFCGRSGSPTKVKKIESVVLTGQEIRMIPSTENGVGQLVHELIEEHILG